MPDYQKKTVVELTEILKARALPHSGKKAELVARLNEADRAADEAQDVVVPPPPATSEPATVSAPAVTATQPSTEQPAATSTNSPTTAQPQQQARESSATTDTKLATAVDYSMNLPSSTLDEEMKKRKARAERFGTTNTGVTDGADIEALKAIERAKRFGNTQAASGDGVGKLDEALSMERARKGKRGREENGGSMDDPGLNQGRGGKRRFQGRGGRGGSRPGGQKPEGVKKNGGATAKSAFSSAQDRLAAEARKKKFAT